jgi:hypothetical protein
MPLNKALARQVQKNKAESAREEQSPNGIQ